MKYFKLYENWNGDSVFEATVGNLEQLKESLIAGADAAFKGIVDEIFTSKKKQINVQYTNPITNKPEEITIKPEPLRGGSGNTFLGKKVKEVGIKEIAKFAKDYDNLILTYAGKTRKVRTQYGERICEVETPDNLWPWKKANSTYLGRIFTLYQVATQISNVELVEKVAPGIGYEKMQVDNLDAGLEDIFGQLTQHTPLHLFINNVDMNVSIDGGVKVEGTPKSDLAFGDGDKPNFWVSYKHGEYINDDGTVDKVSFQQYGSISSFFNKKFDKALADVEGIRGIMSTFFKGVREKAIELEGSGSRSFDGVTAIEVNDDYTEMKVVVGDKETIIDNIPKDKLEELSKNETSIKRIAKSGPIDLTILYKDGFSARKNVLELGKVGKDITMLSIFGIDYGPGKKPGEENVNVLMQDAAPFGIQLRLDDAGNAEGVDITTSSNGHVMFNPELYKESTEPPHFLDKYEPYFVARYTGGNNQYWKEGNKNVGIIGIRTLIMPEYHSKQDTDI